MRGAAGERQVGMSFGMLWFDADKVSLEQRLEKAAAYFERKYGARPGGAILPPGSLSEETAQVAGLTCSQSRMVHKNHIWLTVEGGANGSNAG